MKADAKIHISRNFGTDRAKKITIIFNTPFKRSKSIIFALEHFFLFQPVLSTRYNVILPP